MEQEKYTQRVLNTLQSAQQNAALRYHQEITSLHVLMALAQEPEGLLGTIFQEAGVDNRMLQTSVEEHLKKIPSVKDGQFCLYLKSAIDKFFTSKKG